MTKTVNLDKDFDSPRDVCAYMDSLAAKGVPYEHIDDHTIIVFDDEEDREKWMELASEPGGFFEKQVKKQRLKDAVDELSYEEVDKLLAGLEQE